MRVAQCKSIICHLVCSNGWSLDSEESETPIFLYIYYKFYYRILSDQRFTLLWTDSLSLSLNGLMQIVNSSGFSLQLFPVWRCTIVLSWYSGGVKLQLCHSTIQILTREFLLQSFLTWVTVFQVSYLFTTLNCSKTCSFWVHLLLLNS